MRVRHFICFLTIFLLSVGLSVAAEKKAPMSAKKAEQTVKTLLAEKKSDQPFEKNFQKIVALGPPAVPSLLQFGSQSEHELDQRWTAVRAVGKIGDKQALPRLTEFLKDPHPTMRIAALRALGDLGSPDSIKDIMTIAENDPALLVRNAAVHVLGQLKAIEALPTLEKVFWDEKNFIKGKSLFIRRRAIVAMGEIEARAATPILIKALDDKDTSIPPVAISSLERINRLKFDAKDNKQSVNALWKNWWEAELRRIPLLPSAQQHDNPEPQGS